MTLYVATVERNTIFGLHTARIVISDIDQLEGLARLIQDGDWTCRPLEETEKEALRGDNHQ